MSRVLITYTAIGLVVFSILGIGLWLFYPSNKSPYPSIGTSPKEKLDYYVNENKSQVNGNGDFKKTVIPVEHGNGLNVQNANEQVAGQGVGGQVSNEQVASQNANEQVAGQSTVQNAGDVASNTQSDAQGTIVSANPTASNVQDNGTSSIANDISVFDLKSSNLTNQPTQPSANSSANGNGTEQKSSTKVFTNLKQADFEDLPKPELSKVKNPVAEIGQPKVQASKADTKEQVLNSPTSVRIERNNGDVPTGSSGIDIVYWIQVASMENKDNIEKLKNDLDLNVGGKGVIFKITGKDQKIYYRLRYGPYSEKADVSVINEKIRLHSNIDTVVFENKVER